jgi:aryl-alcohol dehydrogenase-like predicted oxidoreductase
MSFRLRKRDFEAGKVNDGNKKAMKKLVRDGKIRSVGVSNFKLRTLKASQNALAPLEVASNQVRYSLLNRDVEKQLLPYAQDAGITIIAYSPLAQGLLTGKYGAENKPSTFIQTVNPGFSSRNLNRLKELESVLAELGKAYEKTPSQVALNWLTSKKGVVPIPGIKKVEHAVGAAGAVGWSLTDLELDRLEKAAGGVEFDRLSAIPNLLRAPIRYG